MPQSKTVSPQHNGHDTVGATPILPSDFDQPTAIIRLTGKNLDSILDKPFELYERTRAAWRGSPTGRIAKSTLVLVAVGGVVRETYAVAGWFRDELVMRANGKKGYKNKISFVGNLAKDSVRAKFNGRSVAGLFPRGAISPIVTFGPVWR